MSLREHERVCVTIKNKAPKMRLSDFHPETYVLDDKGEFDMFCEAYKGALSFCWYILTKAYIIFAFRDKM